MDNASFLLRSTERIPVLSVEEYTANWWLFLKLVKYLIWGGRELMGLFILILTPSRTNMMKAAA